VLLAADGHSNAEIARLVGMTEKTVRKWQSRIKRWKHLDALEDAKILGAVSRIFVDSVLGFYRRCLKATAVRRMKSIRGVMRLARSAGGGGRVVVGKPHR
jgi:hypothetical protein